VPIWAASESREKGVAPTKLLETASAKERIRPAPVIAPRIAGTGERLGAGRVAVTGPVIVGAGTAVGASTGTKAGDSAGGIGGAGIGICGGGAESVSTRDKSGNLSALPIVTGPELRVPALGRRRLRPRPGVAGGAVRPGARRPRPGVGEAAGAAAAQ
jgi:hypothetical protein